ncbi:MAG: preprotein translocase subunit SecG [Chloroflexota bacterium]|nr:preprotein translocase subunit SecG [Chloroflexota bacterium]
MSTYLYIAQLIIASTLIGVILLQTQESGLGSPFGGGSSLHRSRRGVEKMLFQITIGLSVAFFIMALITVVWAS